MYQITFKQSANKELQQIPKHVIVKIVHAIEGLETDPRPVGVKKLKGSEEDLYRRELVIIELELVIIELFMR